MHVFTLLFLSTLVGVVPNWERLLHAYVVYRVRAGLFWQKVD